MIIYIMENHQYALFLCVNQDNPYRSQYQEKVNQHNSQLTQNMYIDSGFDLFVPKEINMMVHEVNKVDFDVKCEMKRRENGEWVPTGFYMYPRSSISKTKFRLANNVGIIDSGYRGNLIGMFDVIYSQENVKCEAGKRLLQICTPTLEPFKIILQENDEGLSDTRRGSGGIGSTGE